MQASTVRSKILRKRSAPHLCRIRVSEDWQRLVQAIADEPPDPEVDLRLPHQATIVHDPEQEACEHQPDGDLRIDPRSPVVLAVEIRNLRPEPSEIEDAIHLGKNVVVGDELSKRARHEQLELTEFLVSKHAGAPRQSIAHESHEADFFNSPKPSSTARKCAGIKPLGTAAKGAHRIERTHIDLIFEQPGGLRHHRSLN